MSGTIAIITARGGSKRIPRKNIRLFHGKPMIAYAVEAAVQAGCFDEIMVSTDDREIADIALAHGACVPFMRSEKTANDYATTAEVLAEVLAEYKARGRHYDLACCIYPCVPFLRKETLLEACETLKNDPLADCAYSVCRYSTPVERALQINAEGHLEFWHPEYARTRSQDLSPKFFDAAQFYFFRTQAFEEHKTLALKNTYPVEVSWLNCQDIDNEEDWEAAEFKYNMLQAQCRK